MSTGENEGTLNGLSEPEMKRQRVDGAVSVTTSRARPYSPDGPMDDEATAREKLEKAGFDPDDINAINEVDRPRDCDDDMQWVVNPMIHFCAAGDLKMCRYLLSKGASTTALCPEKFWFPLYAASIYGKLEACKWLYKNGAANQLRKRNEAGSPMEVAKGVDMCVWMVLNGAISDENDPQKVDKELMKKDLFSKSQRILKSSYRNSSHLLAFTGQQMTKHLAFIEFLKGTLIPPTYQASLLPCILAQRLRSKEAAEMILQTTPQDQHRALWAKLHLSRHQSILQCLCGKVGILDQIAKFVGAPRGRDLSIIRGINECLPRMIEFFEEVQQELDRYEENDNSSSSNSVSDPYATSPELGFWV